MEIIYNLKIYVICNLDFNFVGFGLVFIVIRFLK